MLLREGVKFMTGLQLKNARKQKRLTQSAAARHLGVSQGYLSLLEKGKRLPTEDLITAVIRLYGLRAADLPVKRDLTKLPAGAGSDSLAADLSAIGYPGFSHLGKSFRLKNPAEVLISVLAAGQLDPRVVESLPWLVSEVSETSWGKVSAAAKVNDLQNRLGFVTSLARMEAEKRGEFNKAARLRRREAALAGSVLVKEDTLCNETMTETEKQWVRGHRTPEAELWNVLSDLKIEHLNYAD